MSPTRDEGPPGRRPPSVNNDDITIAQPVDQMRAADIALHCAWLRVNAEATLDLDPSGQIEAYLLDYACALEKGEALGWFR